MAPDGNPAGVPGTAAPAPGRTRVVLLDALGTLVGLQPPAPQLVRALGARGVRVPLATATAAVGAEMACYRAEHHRGGTPAGLLDVRRRCATVLRASLGLERARVGDEALLDVLAETFRFFAYPDGPAVLAVLRARGLRLVVCSNWDLSLHEVLDATGLRPLVDGVVVSAVEGVAKPDPRLFARALEVAGVRGRGAAVHVGDSVAADVHGALGAGIRPVRITRAGDEVRSHDENGAVAPPGTAVIRDLSALPALL